MQKYKIKLIKKDFIRFTMGFYLPQDHIVFSGKGVHHVYLLTACLRGCMSHKVAYHQSQSVAHLTILQRISSNQEEQRTSEIVRYLP